MLQYLLLAVFGSSIALGNLQTVNSQIYAQFPVIACALDVSNCNENGPNPTQAGGGGTSSGCQVATTSRNVC